LGLVYTSSRDALLRSAVDAEGQENELLAGIVMANTDAVFTQADAIARYVQTEWLTLDREEIKRLAHSNRWGQGDIQHVEVADVSGRIVFSSRGRGGAIYPSVINGIFRSICSLIARRFF
jgi:hypothetical protein